MPTPTRRPNRTAPTYDEEARLHDQGFELVAGLDEVGRGPLAGPVVAGVAVLPHAPRGRWFGMVRDSKQMTAAQREDVLPHLKDEAIALEVGVAGPEEVDEHGIVAATRMAMRRALDRLPLRADFLLLDAFPLPGVYTPQRAIIHGDSLCLSIAAASIMAKVVRDDIMRRAEGAFPGYGFARHKGYGTAEHLRQLGQLGPCSIHRYTFGPVRAQLDEDSPLYSIRPPITTSTDDPA